MASATGKYAEAARWMQLIGVPVMLALLFWNFNIVYNMSITLGKLEERLGNTQEQLKISADDRYRATQAKSDFALRDSQLATLQERLQNMEQRFIVTGQRITSIDERVTRIDKNTVPTPASPMMH